jgi:hypothetical protein
MHGSSIVRLHSIADAQPFLRALQQDKTCATSDFTRDTTTTCLPRPIDCSQICCRRIAAAGQQYLPSELWRGVMAIVHMKAMWTCCPLIIISAQNLIEGHGTLPSGDFGCRISYLGDDYTLVDVSIGPAGPNQLLYHYSVIFSFEAWIIPFDS